MAPSAAEEATSGQLAPEQAAAEALQSAALQSWALAAKLTEDEDDEVCPSAE